MRSRDVGALVMVRSLEVVKPGLESSDTSSVLLLHPLEGTCHVCCQGVVLGMNSCELSIQVGVELRLEATQLMAKLSVQELCNGCQR